MSPHPSPQSKLPPGPAWSPAEATLRWLFRPIALMEGCRARYGDTFTIRFLHEGTTVLISHPEDMQRFFTADPTTLHAGEGRPLLKPIFGANSLTCLDEDAHRAQRRLLLPPFHGERLKTYTELIADITRTELASCEMGRPVKLGPHLRAIALKVILHAIFGVRDTPRGAQLQKATTQLLNLTSSLWRMAPLMLLGPTWALRVPTVRRLLQRVDTIIFSEIEARREEPDLAERTDVLSLLMAAKHDDGTAMTPVEIRDHMITLLIGGHETTAAALGWGIERLSRSPQAMERLRSEVMTGEDIYLDAVTKETLRIRSPLPVVSRLTKKPLELRDHIIPEETLVAACTYLTHHDPEIYPDPYRFRPERFLDLKAGTYAWLPFGGGMRRCLGSSFAMLEIKTVLRVVSENLWVTPTSSLPEAIGRRAITLVPKHGCEVVLEQLTDSASYEAVP
jgi:cytochrome P450 family 135